MTRAGTGTWTGVTRADAEDNRESDHDENFQKRTMPELYRYLTAIAHSIEQKQEEGLRMEDDGIRHRCMSVWPFPMHVDTLNAFVVTIRNSFASSDRRHRARIQVHRADRCIEFYESRPSGTGTRDTSTRRGGSPSRGRRRISGSHSRYQVWGIAQLGGGFQFKLPDTVEQVVFGWVNIHTDEDEPIHHWHRGMQRAARPGRYTEHTCGDVTDTVDRGGFWTSLR